MTKDEKVYRILMIGMAPLCPNIRKNPKKGYSEFVEKPFTENAIERLKQKIPWLR